MKKRKRNNVKKFRKALCQLIYLIVKNRVERRFCPTRSNRSERKRRYDDRHSASRVENCSGDFSSGQMGRPHSESQGGQRSGSLPCGSIGKTTKWDEIQRREESEFISIVAEKAWKRLVTKPCFVGEGFTRKPPKFERFIRPMVKISNRSQDETFHRSTSFFRHFDLPKLMWRIPSWKRPFSCRSSVWRRIPVRLFTRRSAWSRREPFSK